MIFATDMLLFPSAYVLYVRQHMHTSMGYRAACVVYLPAMRSGHAGPCCAMRSEPLQAADMALLLEPQAMLACVFTVMCVACIETAGRHRYKL